MKTRKYEVWVGPSREADGFKIALKPPVFRMDPVTVKTMAFVSRRSFTSREGARGMADYLFGKLDWKQTKKGWHSDITLATTPRRTR
jgi:hypothetical protein